MSPLWKRLYNHLDISRRGRPVTVHRLHPPRAVLNFPHFQRDQILPDTGFGGGVRHASMVRLTWKSHEQRAAWPYTRRRVRDILGWCHVVSDGLFVRYDSSTP